MPNARYVFLDHPGPIAFAHRGGAMEATENSWEAYRHAHALGYRYIETDVHATSDGVVVTIHDADLSRTTDAIGKVRARTWAQMATVRLHRSADPVPRLDEALAAWPQMRWNIDAKHDSVVGPLIETIHRADAVDRVCVTSFNDRRLAAIRRALGPGLCTGMGPLSVTTLRLASALGGRVGRGIAGPLTRFGAAQIPLRQGRVPLAEGRLVGCAHSLGLQVHVWTVNDPATMDTLLDVGVDGIMTDRPSTLKDVLVRRGSWL